jgi:hypothetical protein
VEKITEHPQGDLLQNVIHFTTVKYFSDKLKSVTEEWGEKRGMKNIEH